MLPSKTDAPKHLKDIVALVERQFETEAKTLRSDNGSEFLCLTDYFRENGIVHETSCVWTPQKNGRVERKHRHLLNVARALRFQASLPVEFWSYCALTAGYLINRTPTAVLDGKTPYELLYGKPPPMNHLKVFGCLCYVNNQKHGGDKFASRTNKSIFIGYPFGKKGWRVYNLETRSVSVSRDVIFCETEFPMTEDIFENASDQSLPTLTLYLELFDDEPMTEQTTRVILVESSQHMADHNSETPVPVELGPSPVTDFPHQTDDDNESSSSFTLEELQNGSPPALLPATSPSFGKRRRRRLPRFVRRRCELVLRL